MPTPIAYQHIKSPTGIIEIPIYALSDFPNAIVRLATPNGIGCYDLVEPTNETPIRVQTKLGVKGINLAISSVGSNALNFDNVNVIGVSTVLEANTADYIQIHSNTNGNGVGIPFDGQISDTLNVTMNVDILQGVDDVLSVRLWNITQSKYITTNLSTGTQTSGTHLLSGSFTLTSDHLVNGDQLELRVVQAWKNSTHDDFVFRVMKDSTMEIS